MPLAERVEMVPVEPARSSMPSGAVPGRWTLAGMVKALLGTSGTPGRLPLVDSDEALCSPPLVAATPTAPTIMLRARKPLGEP